MSFTSLLLSDELSVIEQLCSALDDAKIEHEICTELDAARKLIRDKKYGAILVDCDAIEGGAGFVREIRQDPRNRYSVIFAIVYGSQAMREAYRNGANFVFDKPFPSELLAHGLRAAEGFMLREQRRTYRHPVDVLVTLKRENTVLYFTARDLGEEGVGLRNAGELKSGMSLAVHLQIPETETVIEGSAEVIWVDAEGRAGLKFTQLPRLTAVRLREWATERFSEQRNLPVIDMPPKP